jgi:hypothetical protein
LNHDSPGLFLHPSYYDFLKRSAASLAVCVPPRLCTFEGANEVSFGSVGPKENRKLEQPPWLGVDGRQLAKGKYRLQSLSPSVAERQ